MTTVSVLPTATYPAGIHNFGPIAVPTAIVSIEIDIARCTTADLTIWPNAGDTIAMDMELSMDGGVTYSSLASSLDGGGIEVRTKTGLEVPATIVQTGLTAGTNRMLKGSITLSAAIKTSATVTVT